jgi:hypothetical protein
VNTKFADELHKRLDSVERLLKRRDDDVAEMAKAVGDLPEAYGKQRKSIEALQAELANGLRATTAPVSHDTPPRTNGPGAVREELGASLSVIGPTATNMPSAGELRRILQVVAGRFPQYATVPQEVFAAAFRFVQSCSRTAKLDTKHGIEYWLDEAATFCKRHDIGSDALLAAVVAAGDVGYSNPEMSGFASFALVRHGQHVGKEAWRGVLSGNGIVSPTPTAPLDRTIGFVKEIRA